AGPLGPRRSGSARGQLVVLPGRSRSVRRRVRPVGRLLVRRRSGSASALGPPPGGPSGRSARLVARLRVVPGSVDRRLAVGGRDVRLLGLRGRRSGRARRHVRRLVGLRRGATRLDSGTRSTWVRLGGGRGHLLVVWLAPLRGATRPARGTPGTWVRHVVLQRR